MTTRAANGTRETDFYPTVISAAHLAGWRVAHFRPAQTNHGWRTPVQADGSGFPDFVLVHAGAALVWFVELKGPRGQLRPEQLAWGEALITAGAVYRVVRVPQEIDEFCQALIDVVRRG